MKIQDGAEERKLKVEERWLALKEERLPNAKKVEDCAIMFINPTAMDDTAKTFWELPRGKILTQAVVFSLARKVFEFVHVIDCPRSAILVILDQT